MPQFDLSLYPSQIFWLIICMLGLFLYVRCIFVPRIRTIFDQRQNKAQEDIDQANEFAQQAQILREAYDHQIDEAKKQVLHVQKKQLETFEFVRAKRLKDLQDSFMQEKKELSKTSLFDLPEMPRIQDVLLKGQKSKKS